MRYRRLLVVLDLDADPRGALAAVRRVARRAEKVIVFAHPTPGAEAAAAAHLDALQAAWAGAAAEVDLQRAPDPIDVSQAAAATGVDLVVVGPLDRAARAAVVEAQRWLAVPVLWAQGPAPQAPAEAAHILCVSVGARGLASVGVFLRDHVEPHERVSLLAVAPPEPVDDPAALLALSGARAPVTLLPSGLRELPRLIAWAGEASLDLAVLTRAPPTLLLDALARWELPVLVLPVAPERTTPKRPLQAADVVDDGGPFRVRLEQTDALGRPVPLDAEEVAFVAGGRVVATAIARAGEAALPRGADIVSLGVYRTDGAPAGEPLAAVERYATLIRPGPRPLLLFDAGLDDAELAAVHAAAAAPDAPEPLAVRCRPSRRFDLVRERLRRVGLAPPRVIDAATVLDEGEPLDVPDDADAVRLTRVAARLRAAGFSVAAVVYHGPHPPLAVGFAALRAGELTAPPPPPAAPPPPADPVAVRLETTTGAPPIPGNRVEVELDNAEARRRLLAAIAGARRRVHLQVYMAADDELAQAVEGELTAAAARGVPVRVLVDSLHGLHGSLGVHNPLLERLAERPGVEVRVSRPVVGVPSIEDLKQRDHRKLLVVDGEVALVGGRNLAHEYYVGFSEVAVTARTPWRQVPWLDAGARVTGPAVAALEQAFRDAWIAAGGEGFDVAPPAPAGPSTVRVVVHRGLRDAFTLEAYRTLIDTAERRIDVVHSFPLQLEVQHALVRAVRRGVRVRLLFGSVAPSHGEERFSGPLAAARSLATQLVHSRMDPVIAAGAEGYELTLRDVPGWDPALGIVRPHVHAKLLLADGRACAVGSANLDITAAYWESELLLVVEDARVAGAVEAEVDRLVAGSLRVDPSDPHWQALAARRAWMRHWPGLVG